MTRDEAQRLLSEYATGSLTEAQRTKLFAAALEDQELFEELAGEHAVKEILDEPGAKQRLLEALEPAQHKAAWWPWAAATAALAVAVGFVVFQRTRPANMPPQIIAQVAEAPKGSVSAPLPEPSALQAPSPVPLRQKVATAPPPPAPVSELAKDVAQAKPQAAADAVQEFAVATAAGKGGGARRAENVVTAGFGFSYSVLVDGSLQIVPAEPGYLAVIVGDAIVFPSNPVPAFTPVTIPMPAGATSVIIGFSRMPGVTGSPVPRDGLAGRENDQDPPNGKILIQLSLKPATQ